MPFEVGGYPPRPWWNAEFWNKRVTRSFQYGDVDDYTPFPSANLAIDASDREADGDRGASQARGLPRDARRGPALPPARARDARDRDRRGRPGADRAGANPRRRLDRRRVRPRGHLPRRSPDTGLRRARPGCRPPAGHAPHGRIRGGRPERSRGLRQERRRFEIRGRRRAPARRASLGRGARRDARALRSPALEQDDPVARNRLRLRRRRPTGHRGASDRREGRLDRGGRRSASL